MRRRHWLLLTYLALLLASHLVRWGRDAPAAAETLPAVNVAVQTAEERPRPGGAPPGQVHLAYRRWGEAAADRPVLLLHGSPGSSRDFLGLGPLLAQTHHVVAPDLPGFGASSHAVPDYSIAAHAGYALALLDTLGLERVHVVGFSMGGGVALEIAGRAPERVASLTLLSAIGVQELELLGQYHLNHGLHGLQLGALWLLHEAVPHFGALDGVMLDVPYARNFYDSDQRPLRAILERWAGPLLILHGEGDVLVPMAAAREHHRLVPQSELVAFPDNHFLVFLTPERLAPPLRDFLARVEAGTALTRADAPPERQAQAAAAAGELPRATGFTRWLLGGLLALATLVSEDLACIAAGLLVAHGRLDFWAAALACSVGIYIGDLLLYGVGRLGRPWLRRAPLKWLVPPGKLERGKRWFRRRGAVVIFFSRLLPGTRLPTYVAAGALDTGFFWFAACLLLPVALWTPLLVGLAWYLGERFLTFFQRWSGYAALGFGFFLVCLWLFLGLGRTASSHAGRRRLLGFWRRWSRWEFWPLWAAYPPVVLYVLWLGIRHRSLTLFTAANPGMAGGGGFVGESKSAILTALAPERVARFRKLEPASATAGVTTVRDFMAGQGLEFPVVLKPDAGQRGSGVTIVRSDDDLLEFFQGEGARQCHLVQEYVAGPELGVFYVRLPGETEGRIFSITEKLLPMVVGDGRSTVEQLVLDDPRAVALASVYLEALGERADDVPPAGHAVRLVELGTHCRGAVFLDGRRYGTPALTAAVDAVARSYAGFHFGRFDLRGSTPEALLAGEFKVLELNGVTSEATHIYDPAISLVAAYRVLFAQWRLAFEAGRANRERGVQPLTVREVLRLIRDARRTARAS